MIEKIKAIFRTLLALPYGPAQKFERKKDYAGNDVGCTMQCPHCETWTHELTREEWAQYKYTFTDPISDKKSVMTCGKCQQKSEWFTGAPMPIPYSDVRKVE